VTVEGVAVTPFTGGVKALVGLVAAVVDGAPEVCCEVLLLVLAVPVGVELVVTGIATGRLLCVLLELPELDELPEVVAAETAVVNSKLEHAIASARAAIDLKLINMDSPPRTR
jgi:hypothetical protein